MRRQAVFEPVASPRLRRSDSTWRRMKGSVIRTSEGGIVLPLYGTIPVQVGTMQGETPQIRKFYLEEENGCDLMDAMTLAEIVVKHRMSKRISRTELASLLHMTEKGVYKIERGQSRVVRFETQRKLAEVLGISMEAIKEAQPGPAAKSPAKTKVSPALLKEMAEVAAKRGNTPDGLLRYMIDRLRPETNPDRFRRRLVPEGAEPGIDAESNRGESGPPVERGRSGKAKAGR